MNKDITDYSNEILHNIIVLKEISSDDKIIKQINEQIKIADISKFGIQDIEMYKR